MYNQYYYKNKMPMDKSLKKDLGKTFEKIFLTKSQIRDFELEHLKNPDPDVLELERDSQGVHEYGGYDCSNQNRTTPLTK